MNKFIQAGIIMPIILLVACSDEHNANEHQTNERHMNQNTSVLSAQMQALEKANGVEQLMEDRFQAQKEDIDKLSK